MEEVNLTCNESLIDIMKEMKEGIDCLAEEMQVIKNEIADMKKSQGEIINNINDEKLENLLKYSVDNIIKNVSTINEEIVFLKKELLPVRQGTGILIKELADIKSKVINIEMINFNADNKLSEMNNIIQDSLEKGKLLNEKVQKANKSNVDTLKSMHENITRDLKDIKVHFLVSDDDKTRIKAKVNRIK